MDELEQLAEKLVSALDVQGVDATVSDVAPLYGGACQENFRVELDTGVFALRGDANASLPGSIRRAQEFAIINAATDRGVPTPGAHYLLPDLLGEGRDAYLMDWADGVAIGKKVVKGDALAGAREVLPQQLAEALGSIHALRREDVPGFTNEEIANSDPIDAGLGFCEDMLKQLPEPRPAMAYILRWLDRHRPEAGEEVLCHGDFRTGNFLVGPDGLNAVLDWEFAHWGVREDDIGWFCVRDWRFGQLNRPAGGITTRADFYARYEAATGYTLDPVVVHWWEVQGNLRWGAGAVYQAERYLSGEERDLELLAIARRACEMEFEAIRLIENGPPEI